MNLILYHLNLETEQLPGMLLGEYGRLGEKKERRVLRRGVGYRRLL